MTVASARTASGPAAEGPTPASADPLSALGLLLDRELLAVRRHRLELAGRVPERAARHVDTSRGMLELLVDGEDGGVVVLAVAPGARGDTVVPLLPAPLIDDLATDGTARDVSDEEPFATLLGDEIEDVSRLVTHPEHPEDMRGIVLHLGGRMLLLYADLWELRVTLLP